MVLRQIFSCIERRVFKVDNKHIPVPLPPDYHENVLFLLVQSPKVLYVYWELSPGLKELLEEEEKVQIRLNIEGRGAFFTTDLDMSQKSFYFSDVEPGFAYNCEIGIMNHENVFYPLLRSNSVNTPLDRPADSLPQAEKTPSDNMPPAEEPPSDNMPSSSSWVLKKGW